MKRNSSSMNSVTKRKRGCDTENISNDRIAWYFGMDNISGEKDSVDDRCKFYFKNKVSDYNGIRNNFPNAANSQVRTEKEYGDLVSAVE